MPVDAYNASIILKCLHIPIMLKIIPATLPLSCKGAGAPDYEITLVRKSSDLHGDLGI